MTAHAAMAAIDPRNLVEYAVTQTRGVEWEARKNGLTARLAPVETDAEYAERLAKRAQASADKRDGVKRCKHGLVLGTCKAQPCVEVTP